jgi:hypothetical protein
MTTMTTMTAPGKGTLIMEVVAKASGLIRGERQSGVGVVISHHPRWKNSSTGDVPRTPTSTKMAGENRHILSSSAENLFDSVKRFRRRCGQNSPLQAL